MLGVGIRGERLIIVVVLFTMQVYIICNMGLGDCPQGWNSVYQVFYRLCCKNVFIFVKGLELALRVRAVQPLLFVMTIITELKKMYLLTQTIVDLSWDEKIFSILAKFVLTEFILLLSIWKEVKHGNCTFACNCAWQEHGKLIERQEQTQGIKGLHQELEMMSRRNESLQMKLASADRENSILHLNIRQHDMEIARLQTILGSVAL